MLLLKAFLLLTVLIPMITSTTDVETRKKRSVSSYAVEGCYSLFPAANLTKQMWGHNSNVRCQETCREKGYILAATKGDQCQCGNVYPRGNKVNDSQCTSRCRSWSSCHGAQSCCGGPSAYTVSVVGNIDVAKQVLRRLSHEWQTNTGFRNYMKSLVRRPTTGSHVEDWSKLFNRRGWSLCGRGRYMAGLYRNSRRSNDYIHLIEQAYCVDAPGYLYSAKKDQYCYDHNWWKSFNNKGWSRCSNGYYMTGLWRNSGNKLYHIEEAKCCKPNSQVTRWGECYNHNAWKSFNNRGWTDCKPGYYMVGLYRNSCNKLYCLEEYKCCKMGAYNGYSWLERPDLVIKVKDQGQLKQCSMNAMDYSADSETYKCNAISDCSNMLAINALKFNIEDKSPLNVAKPEPVPGFRPVICSAHSNPYKCTKWLTTSVSTSSTLKVGSGFSVAVTTLGSAQISAPKFGIGASFGLEVTKTKYFNVESSITTTYTTTDKTDVSIQVPKDTEITINLLRTVQDLEYKWKAIFEFSGKYSAKWSNDQELFQDVTTVLSGSKSEMYAFGTWSYPDTDVLRVVITDKYGNKKSEGCEHEPGKANACDL